MLPVQPAQLVPLVLLELPAAQDLSAPQGLPALLASPEQVVSRVHQALQVQPAQSVLLDLPGQQALPGLPASKVPAAAQDRLVPLVRLAQQEAPARLAQQVPMAVQAL